MEDYLNKIIIGTKAGGHAVECLGIINLLEKKFKKLEIAIVTEKRDYINYQEYSKNVKIVYKINPFRNPTRKIINPFYFLGNLFNSLKIIRNYNPEIIICMGANNSYLLGFLGKRILKKRIIAVEALNRINKPSQSPLLLSKFCDEVWLPHKELVGRYQRAKEKYIGFYHPYKELIKKIKKDKKTRKELVISSIAKNKITTKAINGLQPKEILKKMSKTKTLVTNAGITSWEGAELCEKVIVHPLKEAKDNHQVDFAKWLKKKYKNVEVRV